MDDVSAEGADQNMWTQQRGESRHLEIYFTIFTLHEVYWGGKSYENMLRDM
jgi:hypothetical protein